MPDDDGNETNSEAPPWPQRLYDSVWLIAGTAVLAVLAGAAFVLVAVGSLLFGNEIRPLDALPNYAALVITDQPSYALSMRGTAALTAFFLVVLGILYALDWMWLAQLWQFGL